MTLSHFNGIPYVDRNASRCKQHKIEEYPDPKREGWIRTGCRKCGALVGYQPKNSRLTSRRRSAKQEGPPGTSPDGRSGCQPE